MPLSDVDRDAAQDAALAPTMAEVHLGHLRHNVRVLRARAGQAGLMGVVKADAYGHGAVPVARVLREEGVRHFAVATVPEGMALRRAGLDEPILVLSAPLPAYLPAYVRHRLDVTVPSRAVAEAVAAAARQAGPLRAHVKVDTGMGRLGLPPEEAEAVVRLLEAAPGVTLAGLETHLATATDEADAFALEQLERFEPLRKTLGEAFEHVHVAHSGALFHLPQSLAFDRALARVGIALYGLTTAPPRAGLRPLMRLTSRVVQVKTVAAGTTLSYRRTWRAARRSRIATVGAGYADGYPRLLSNRAEVGLRGRRYAVAGLVCMDMFMVNLGAPGGPGDAVGEGDEVVLFGAGGPTTFEVAQWAETITYEICCGISARVPRRYVDA